MGERQSHWQEVYSQKGEQDVSWFQETPEPSLELLSFVNSTHDNLIIDVGGGASRLVDALVHEGYAYVTVLDLSQAALDTAAHRLGALADKVKWIAADATQWEPPHAFDIWHDRAAFHFLTSEEDQTAYVERLKLGLKPGGHVVIGTFAPDGPEKCSGLPVCRHDAASLAKVLGDGFELIDTRRHDHATPWGSVQKFQFSIFRRE